MQGTPRTSRTCSIRQALPGVPRTSRRTAAAAADQEAAVAVAAAAGGQGEGVE